MTLAYFQPSFESNYLGVAGANLSTNTLKVGLIASGTLSARVNSETYATVSDLLANSPGSPLTEVSTSGTGYTRQILTSVSYSKTGLVVTLTSANPSWPSATFSTNYGFLYDDSTGGSDASKALIAIWDFGGVQSVTSTNFTLLVNASGLVTWTAAQ